jgi:hypothetical protein
MRWRGRGVHWQRVDMCELVIVIGRSWIVFFVKNMLTTIVVVFGSLCTACFLHPEDQIGDRFAVLFLSFLIVVTNMLQVALASRHCAPTDVCSFQLVVCSAPPRHPTLIRLRNDSFACAYFVWQDLGLGAVTRLLFVDIFNIVQIVRSPARKPCPRPTDLPVPHPHAYTSRHSRRAAPPHAPLSPRPPHS